MNKKYILLEHDTIINDVGNTLFRIKSLINFANVKKGDLGGYIEKEDNLSNSLHDNAKIYGNAWVYDNTKVFGNAKVYDNARVFGNAWVSQGKEISKIKFMYLEEWDINWNDTHLRIACRCHLISEWKKFDDKEISEMANNALAWWQKYKDFIFTAIELTKDKIC